MKDQRFAFPLSFDHGVCIVCSCISPSLSASNNSLIAGHKVLLTNKKISIAEHKKEKILNVVNHEICFLVNHDIGFGSQRRGICSSSYCCCCCRSSYLVSIIDIFRDSYTTIIYNNENQYGQCIEIKWTTKSIVRPSWCLYLWLWWCYLEGTFCFLSCFRIENHTRKREGERAVSVKWSRKLQSPLINLFLLSRRSSSLCISVFFFTRPTKNHENKTTNFNTRVILSLMVFQKLSISFANSARKCFL